MIIDYKALSADALTGLSREYVISHLSEVEESIELETWVQRVINKVKSGELVVEYSQVDESVSLKNISDIEIQE